MSSKKSSFAKTGSLFKYEEAPGGTGTWGRYASVRRAAGPQAHSVPKDWRVLQSSCLRPVSIAPPLRPVLAPPLKLTAAPLPYAPPCAGAEGP